MTDQELLEAAAKAAEYQNVWGHCADGMWWHEDPDTARIWNPITNDGDALRLAVKLRVSVCQSKRIPASWVCDAGGDNIAEVAHDDAVNYCPYAATRRVIVRAAAAIGSKT